MIAPGNPAVVVAVEPAAAAVLAVDLAAASSARLAGRRATLKTIEK